MSKNNLTAFFVALCLGLTSLLAAQDTASSPQSGSEQTVGPQTDELNAESKQDEAKQDEEQEPKSKAGDEKTDDGDSEKKKPATRTRRSIWSRPSQRVADHSKQSKDFVSVFEPVIASSSSVAVQIMSGKRQVALGTIVDPDGLVLTKASELQGELFCTLNDGSVVKATILGIHPDSDLALLKIDADQLTAVQWSQMPAPQIGKWIASPKTNKKEPMIGVVSVNVRKIPPSSPYMGIRMEPMENGPGVKINLVEADSPADDADLFVEDVILKIDDSEVIDRAGLLKILSNYDVDDRITILVRRFGEEKTLKLTLGARDKVSSASRRSNMQNDMGSKLSRRRKDFPDAFQHDSMLNSNTCGGPIVDLTGKVVGINIARAGRVSSLALPVSTVLPILEILKSGDWAPEVVNKEKIESIDSELKEIADVLGRLPDKLKALDRKYSVEKARMDEIDENIDNLQDRLKARIEEMEKSIKSLEGRRDLIGKKSKTLKTELDSVRKDIRVAEKNRKRLSNKLNQLKGGGQ